MKGLKIAAGEFTVSETVSRMISQIREEGWHIFARIDHAKEAQRKGLALRPTELILFGNPEIGTLLLQDQQISAIDLPMKALAWEDEQGKVHVAYNDTKWLKERHGLIDVKTIGQIARVVEHVCKKGTKK